MTGERGGRRRGVRVAAVAAAVLAAPVTAAAQGADPALTALQERDVYVSPRVLGPAAAAEEATLAEVAAALRDDRRPVKLAVVVGPVGAPSLQVYAERLAIRLGQEGAVVVTRAGGAVVASDGRDGGSLTSRLQGSGVEEIPNPAERLARAARLAAVRVEPEAEGPTATAVLVALALLGGGWAAAVGAGRSGRAARRRLTESRALLRVHLDAVRARAAHLARLPGLPEPERARVEKALGTYAEVLAALQEAGSPEDVEALAPRVGGALDALAAVAARMDEPFAADRPFEGLCSADPGHGLAAGEGPVEGVDGLAPLCTACLESAGSGRPPARRLLSRGGRPVPFDAPPPANDPPAQDLRATPG